MTAPLAIVTGAPGWIGSRLVEAILGKVPDAVVAGAMTDRIRCLVGPRATSQTAQAVISGAQIASGDLTKPESLRTLFDAAAGATVYHCAGIIHPTAGTREFYDVNTRGTEHLLRLSAETGVKRFVYLSSNSVVGVSRDPDVVFDEKTAGRPYLNYGRSKKLAEDAVRSAADRGRIETAIVRAPWFYGPHQPDRQTLFFTMIKSGRVPLVGSGTNRRSMVYVDNLCQGLMLAATSPAARNQTYWIADQRPYTMNEIVSTVADVLEQDFGVPVKRGAIHLPAVASDVAFVADTALQAAGLYHSKIHVLSEMARTIACSTAKAEHEIGYRPAVALREGMRRSIAWLREAGVAF
jgi:nucleoside-diphosphate-sugar epimerase